MGEPKLTEAQKRALREIRDGLKILAPLAEDKRGLIDARRRGLVTWGYYLPMKLTDRGREVLAGVEASK